MIYTLENFYTSKQWEKFRTALMLERMNSDGQIICAHCGKPIVKSYDCIAHHKIELNDNNVNDVRIAFNPELVELIHFRCHNIEHKRFEGFRQEVFLVYGSPCSGKTTFIKNNAEYDDLILDIDRIWESICFSDRLNKPKRLKANVFGIRDTLIDMIRTRRGMWRTAYVIGGYPLRTERDRLCLLLNAQPIFIDESKEICLQRAPTKEWRGFVEDWFDNYIP